jgi:hypothetical protein
MITGYESLFPFWTYTYFSENKGFDTSACPGSCKYSIGEWGCAHEAGPFSLLDVSTPPMWGKLKMATDDWKCQLTIGPYECFPQIIFPEPI